ncbi:2701_t:CDS:2, partial [Dentiscutata erythropus]
AEAQYDLYAKLKGLVWCFGITKHNTVILSMNSCLFYSKDLGSKLLNDSGALTWKNKLSILRRISETLSHIHEMGFTGPEGENSTDNIVGAIPYMAPEALKHGI